MFLQTIMLSQEATELGENDEIWGIWHHSVSFWLNLFFDLAVSLHKKAYR